MTALDAGRDALTRGDHEEARRLLMPLVEESPAGQATVVLARVELDADQPDVALTLLDTFLDARPQHGGAILLRARAKLASSWSGRAISWSDCAPCIHSSRSWLAPISCSMVRPTEGSYSQSSISGVLSVSGSVAGT